VEKKETRKETALLQQGMSAASRDGVFQAENRSQRPNSCGDSIKPIKDIRGSRKKILQSHMEKATSDKIVGAARCPGSRPGGASWSEDLTCSEDNPMCMSSGREKNLSISKLSISEQPLSLSSPFPSDSNFTSKENMLRCMAESQKCDYGDPARYSHLDDDDTDPFSNTCSGNNILNKEMKEGTHIFRAAAGPQSRNRRPPKPSPEGGDCPLVRFHFNYVYFLLSLHHFWNCSANSVYYGLRRRLK
jgi:hypothetical protein